MGITDSAFVVSFVAKHPAERRRLWETRLGDDLPTHDDDLESLKDPCAFEAHLVSDPCCCSFAGRSQIFHAQSYDPRG